MDFNKIKTKIDLDSLPASELFSKENFEGIKYQAYNYMDSLDWDGALDFSKKLEKKIAGISSIGGEQQINFYNILVFWVLRLKLFCFNHLSEQDRADLLRKNIAKMAIFGLHINMYVTKALDFYGSIRPLQKEVGSLFNACSSSVEILGKDIAGFQKLGFKPTLGNWIKEYLSTLSVEGSANRIVPSSFHIVKFLDSNQHVKLLSRLEKEALREILELQNMFLDPIAYIKVQEQVQFSGTKPETGIGYMTEQKGVIQPIARQSYLKTAVPPVIKSAVPEKSYVQQPKPSKPATTNIANTAQKPPLVTPIEIEIQVPPGISFGPPLEQKPAKVGSVLDIKQEIEQKKKLVESEIDKKIEDLKKKTH